MGKNVYDSNFRNITAVSSKSFEHAIDLGLDHANDVLEDIEGAWITEMKVVQADGPFCQYRISMKLALVKNVKSNIN